MSTKLTAHQYGKSRVRVMKILRDGATHTVKELEVAVALSGDFERSYTAGDNTNVIATDTIKNTVNVLAKEQLGLETEKFALALAWHFSIRYTQVNRVEVEIRERVWERLTVLGVPHPHSFVNAENARPFVRVIVSENSQEVESGIEDLLILKSTESGFEGYPRCEFTTLPETRDRIFATALTAVWKWTHEPGDYVAANGKIIAALMQPFALNYSPSVQTTLFQMGEAALAACPEISQVHLAAPNKHCLLIDLRPFGQTNENEIFVPTDEPHGQIEATVSRG